MRCRNKNINCNIQNSDFFRGRVSLIIVGIVCFFLGIQGLTNIFNHQILSVDYIKVYSILMLLGGIFSILLGCIIIERVKYTELTNL